MPVMIDGMMLGQGSVRIAIKKRYLGVMAADLAVQKTEDLSRALIRQPPAFIPAGT